MSIEDINNAHRNVPNVMNEIKLQHGRQEQFRNENAVRMRDSVS